MKELEKRIGQVVAYIKTHEQEKLNPLLEHLIILSRQLDDVVKALPRSERFEEAIKIGDKNIALLGESHKRQMALLRQSQEEIIKQNASMITNLTNTINRLKETQGKITESIETKLGKKIFG